MKNNLKDLNDYLFEELERLNDDELNEDELKRELEKSKAVTIIADKIIQNANLVLQAQKHYDEYGINYNKKNVLLGEEKDA